MIDSWRPATVKAALPAYLPAAEVSVRQREHDGPDEDEWQIARDDDGDWGTYGSLYDALDGLDGERVLDSEHDAVKGSAAQDRRR